MKYLIKLHFKYLITKTTIILSTIFCLLIICILIFSSGIIYSFQDRYMNMENYKESYIGFIQNIDKIIIPLTIIFLFGYSFTEYQDNYLLLFHYHQKFRIKYFISKYLTLFMISLIVIIINLILVNIFGIISLANYQINSIEFSFWLELLLVCLIYGTISALVVMISNNSLGYILIIISYIIISALQDIGGKVVNYIYYVLPSIQNNFLNSNILYLCFILLFYLLITFIVYYYKNR